MTHSIEVLKQLNTREKAEVEVLLREYLAWAVPLFNAQNNLDLDLDEALASAADDLKEYLPPHGCTILARDLDGVANAIGFYRRIKPEAAEIKRLYLRPSLRGEGIGRRLVEQLVKEAKAAGYSEIYLDTAKFMTSAQALYRSLGFEEIDEYPEAEHSLETSPHLVFMAAKLK